MATRHERVIIDLDDRFTEPAARMAAASSLLRKNVDDSGRSVVAFDKTTRETAPSIDKLSGRLAILTRTAAVLGPGLAPIATAAVPAIAGLSTQLGFAAAAAGTAVLAFKGVGEGLKAVNEYQLKPTQENFEKMQEAMKGLGPAAREFVGFLDHIGPKLQTLRTAAQDGLLPGVQDGIESLMTRLPQLRRIMSQIADAAGDVVAGFGQDLASSRWNDFFDFLEKQARPTLIELGQTVSNVAHGLAELWMAFSPLSADFTGGLLKATAAFDDWATSLSQTQGFQEFMAYIRETGPQVLETVGALANALLQVVEAAAPLGGPVLRAIEGIANAIATLADSPLGTPLLALVSAMSALSLATNTWGKVLDSSIVGNVKKLPGDLRVLGTSLAGVQWERSAVGAERYALATSRLGNMAKQAAGVAGLALATSGLADKTGVANTASGALLGTLAGPWGTAIGGAIGFAKDFAKANDGIEASLQNVDSALASNSLEQYRSALARLQADTQHLADDKSGLFGFTGNLNRVSAFLSGANGDIARKAAFLKGEIRDTANATGGLASIFGSALGPQLGTTANGFEIAAASADDFRSSLQAVNDFLAGRANFRAYQQSLDDFTKGLKENGKAFREFGQAGRANNANLDNIAASALKVAENMKGMNRINFLDKARSQFVDAASKMGYTAKQAQNLANKAGLVDKADPTLKVSEKGSAETGRKVDNVKSKAVDLNKYVAHPTLLAHDLATGKISLAEAALARLNGDRADTYIYTHHIETVTKKVSRQLGEPGVATGGHITGPGTGTSDSIPAWLSNGEYVIKAAAVAKYGTHMFDRLNAMAFASGGSVDSKLTPKERAARAKAARARAAAAARSRNNAMFSFDLQADQSPDRIASEFHSFRNAMHLGAHSLTELQHQALGVVNTYAAHNAILKADTKALEALQNQVESFHDGIVSQFTGGRTGNGLFGLRVALRKQGTAADALFGAEQGALTKGLDLNLAKELIAAGDTRTLSQIASLSKSDVAALSKQYQGTTASINRAADFGTQATFGKQIADQNALIRQQSATLKALNRSIEAIEKRAQQIHVHGIQNPAHVAKEVARRQRHAGAR